jgi:hypothetical protein
MQQLAVGRTRSEPVAAAALPLALAPGCPPAPAPAVGSSSSSSSTGSPPPAGAEQQPDNPSSGGRRLQLNLQQKTRAGRGRRPPFPAAPASRRRSATPESSARHTPFAAPSEVAPARPAAVPAVRPATSPSQRQLPQRVQVASAPSRPTTSPSPQPPAGAPQLPAAQLPVDQQLLPPQDEEGEATDAPDLPWAAAAAASRPELLSSLPRRLHKDLLALLRRQRSYVGARRQVGAGGCWWDLPVCAHNEQAGHSFSSRSSVALVVAASAAA